MDEEREPLGKRIKRFVSLVVIVLTITTAVIVTQRLSSDALALLIGLIAGIAVMVPMIAFLIFIWRRQEMRRQEQNNRQGSTHPPQVVVVSPPVLPGYSANRPALWDQNQSGNWALAPNERNFTIVGGES